MPANDVWTVSVGAATSGSFTLTFGGQTTAAIQWNDTAASVQTKIAALSTVGAGNVTVTGLNGQSDAALPGDTLQITLVGAKGIAANGNFTKTDTTLTSTLTHTVTGSAGVEPSTGAYARTSIVFPSTTTTQTSNSGSVTFPQSTGSGYSASAITGWGIYDAATVGNCWYYDVFAGTNDVYTLSYTFTTAPTGGSFTVTLTGTAGNEIGTSSAIPWNADALTIQSILEELAGAGNVQVRVTAGGTANLPPLASAGAGMTITFLGSLRYAAQTLALGVNSLTGGTGTPTPVFTHATTGASGSFLVNQSGVSPTVNASTLVITES